MWQRFVVVFLMTLCLGGSAAFGFILLVDPYDRGHPGLGWLSGIVDEDPRTASASRGRDRRFNSAVIGNSHGQLIDPARLSSGTGLNFVQLTVPGTGPREQLTLMQWFIDHHDHIGAVVLAADSTWCTQDPALPITTPFPFWLYTESNAEYAANVLRSDALDRGWRRILVAFGIRHESDPTGFSDYERGRSMGVRSQRARRAVASVGHPEPAAVVPGYREAAGACAPARCQRSAHCCIPTGLRDPTACRWQRCG